MKPFFITGLPRTRTAWFANLFTTDRTHCFHEWLPLNNTDTILQDFQKVRKQYVGESGTCLCLFIEKIKKRFPKCPIVLIERPCEEVAESLINAFSDAKIDLMLQKLQSLEKIINQIKKENNVLCVSFNSLHKERAIEKIWQHCVPTIRLDRIRLELLQKIKITVNYTSLKEGGFL